MFYMGGMTFGYLEPPKPVPQKLASNAGQETAQAGPARVDLASEPRKSADATPFLWVRQWMM